MRRRLFGGLLALPLLLGPVLAGCAGGPSGPEVATAGGGAGASPSTSAAPVSDEDRQREFARCMRENGVEMPDPEPGKGPRIRLGGNVDPEKAQAAMEQCRHLLPNGGKALDLSPEQIERMREMAKCMRENGVPDFPDPNPDGSLDLKSLGLKLDDPKLKAGLEKCRKGGPVVITGGGGK
ncbi:hypothetical protein [Plantactinospora sp. B5E13]|uniref:hypothetical protein n=1 Tax=unclassified Plantactinospora TaxID=2631981 RepID=UPI00325CFD47